MRECIGDAFARLRAVEKREADHDHDHDDESEPSEDCTVVATLEATPASVCRNDDTDLDLAAKAVEPPPQPLSSRPRPKKNKFLGKVLKSDCCEGCCMPTAAAVQVAETFKVANVFQTAATAPNPQNCASHYGHCAIPETTF